MKGVRDMDTGKEKSVLCKSAVKTVERPAADVINIFLNNGVKVVYKDELADIVVINKGDQVEIATDDRNGTLCVSYGTGDYLFNFFRVPKEAVNSPV